MARTVEDVRKHYDGLSFGDFTYGDQRAALYPLVDEFVALIGPASRVIDVGCGAGFWLDELARRGVRKDQLRGVDLSPANVERARARGYQAETGNVLALTMSDASFDGTFCAGVIHHTPDPAQALRELARITAPGGHIYLAVYNWWHPYFWLVHKATAPLRALHWRGFTRASKAAYAAWRPFAQLLGYAAFGKWVDERTCYALWMDQVLTPYAHLYTTADVKRQADASGLDVVETRPALGRLMIVALLRRRQT
jgi:SAM-dependent methyltransferase